MLVGIPLINRLIPSELQNGLFINNDTFVECKITKNNEVIDG
jgi:hypothetical protein